MVSNMGKSMKDTCPVMQVIVLLSDKWTMLIMSALTEGPKRFCEIEYWLKTISTRTLTLKLKKLIEVGLVTKLDTGYYTVTKKGDGIKIIERAMRKYQKLYLP